MPPKNVAGLFNYLCRPLIHTSSNHFQIKNLPATGTMCNTRFWVEWMDESGPENNRKVGNMEDLVEKSKSVATAASHLSGLKILDGVLQILTVHLTTSLEVSLVNSLLIS